MFCNAGPDVAGMLCPIHPHVAGCDVEQRCDVEYVRYGVMPCNVRRGVVECGDAMSRGIMVWYGHVEHGGVLVGN